MGSNPHSLGNPAEVADQTARCFELKLQGWSYRRIAAELHISAATVHNRVQAAVADRLDPLVEEHRQLELAKLEEAERPLWVQILAEDPKALARNVEVYIKLSERRSRLLGMDAPQQAEITATVEEVPAIVAKVQAAREAAQARERAILEEPEDD